MVYDKYGKDGLKLYEQGFPQIDFYSFTYLPFLRTGVFGDDGRFLKFIPFFSNPWFLISVFCSIPITPLLLVIFISLQVDHIVSWNWAIILLP